MSTLPIHTIRWCPITDSNIQITIFTLNLHQTCSGNWFLHSTCLALKTFCYGLIHGLVEG